jgi:hypothetical protein
MPEIVLSLVVIALLTPLAEVGDSGTQVSVGVRDLFNRYMNGDYELHQLFRSIPASRLAVELPQAARESRPQSSRDRQRIATLALEAAHASVSNGGLERPHRARGDGAVRPTYFESLVAFGRDQLGSHPPSTPFLGHWYHTAIAVCETAQLGALVEQYAEEGLAGFPGHARFVLARAVAVEILSSPYAGVAQDSSARWLNDGSRRFMSAMSFQEVQGEAQLRLGFLESRAGLTAEALRHLADADASLSDPSLRYLARLFQGRILTELNRLDEAEASLRDALQLVPGAQSATLTLASVRLRKSDRAGASLLTDALLSRPARAPDPWWTYWIGDGRLWSEIVATVRQDLK